MLFTKIVYFKWNVFRGNDIDYIEIKTDDGDVTTGGAEKRKNYNYR